MIQFDSRHSASLPLRHTENSFLRFKLLYCDLSTQYFVSPPSKGHLKQTHSSGFILPALPSHHNMHPLNANTCDNSPHPLHSSHCETRSSSRSRPRAVGLALCPLSCISLAQPFLFGRGEYQIETLMSWWKWIAVDVLILFICETGVKPYVVK